MGEKMLEQAEGDVDKSEAEAAVRIRWRLGLLSLFLGFSRYLNLFRRRTSPSGGRGILSAYLPTVRLVKGIVSNGSSPKKQDIAIWRTSSRMYPISRYAYLRVQVELEDVGKAIEESMEEAQEEYSESAIEAEQEVRRIVADWLP